jgi:cell shape-determining protein MreD
MSLMQKRIVLIVASVIAGILGEFIFWRALGVVVKVIANLTLIVEKVSLEYHLLSILLIALMVGVILDLFMKTEFFR